MVRVPRRSVNIDHVNMTTLLTTAEVARRLGVKPETVYAYVSRGLLARDPASGHRRSLFDPAAVEALADRARHGNRSGAVEVTVRTELTAIDPAGRLFYRGRDAVGLARHSTFEDVAGLLWGGDPGAPWRLRPADRRLLQTLRAGLPADARPADLIVVAIAALGATDAQAGDRRPAAVIRAAGRMGAGAVAVLTDAARPPAGTAQALWRALSPRTGPPPRNAVAALDAALVLLADHELSASAFATRVAASAWADPYRAVLAGLGPLGGALHGAASSSARAMLDEIAAPDGAFAALDRRAAAGPVPGFGHPVYRDRDPRADHLLDRARAVAVDATRARTVAALTTAAADLGLPAPNADLGLAGLTYVLGLPGDAPATIFTVARLAGLVAHTLEEYPHRLRFRPRATYVGVAPRP
jgi:citrate synthase